MMISNDKLYNKVYDIEILMENIEHLNLNVILNTQQLTVQFCVKYILNGKYQTEQDEKYICLSDITRKQPHINIEELILCLLDPNN